MSARISRRHAVILTGSSTTKSGTVVHLDSLAVGLNWTGQDPRVRKRLVSTFKDLVQVWFVGSLSTISSDSGLRPSLGSHLTVARASM